ncbi:tRNA (guanosine(46)-N7)-methyltransferase TrmB [Buchnera aphidicola]|uniref:tRNA (guanosine(46)-N7)-methyltransferase TrmB n=1 Tax=Buchnera aphidicola TaxID=9 RepID=UPI003BEF1EA1
MKNNILTPQYNENGNFLRQIRSFVCRKGRITISQSRSIKNYWHLFGIDFHPIFLNFNSIFNNNFPIILEIGFGTGKSLVDTAINYPKKNFLGIEVYKSGIGSCLSYAFFKKVTNLKIIYYDAIEVLNKMIMNNTLHMIQIFFPDPWHKKRHHKRRIIQDIFLKIVLKKIKVGGFLHISTDSESYAYMILDIIRKIPSYRNLSEENNFIVRPDSRPITKFEKKAHFLGNQIFDLMFITTNE